jgi:hypothetical protein
MESYVEKVEQCIVPYMGSLVFYSKAGNLCSSAKLEGDSRKKRSPLSSSVKQAFVSIQVYWNGLYWALFLIWV